MVLNAPRSKWSFSLVSNERGLGYRILIEEGVGERILVEEGVEKVGGGGGTGTW